MIQRRQTLPLLNYTLTFTAQLQKSTENLSQVSQVNIVNTLMVATSPPYQMQPWLAWWASNRSSVFFCMVSMFYSTTLTLSVQASPSWSSWTLLIAYSTAKLKSNGDKVSPCFRPFWKGNLSDRFLPIQTALYVSFKHILIGPTSFLGIPNSVGILYNTYLLNES